MQASTRIVAETEEEALEKVQEKLQNGEIKPKPLCDCCSANYEIDDSVYPYTTDAIYEDDVDWL